MIRLSGSNQNVRASSSTDAVIHSMKPISAHDLMAPGPTPTLFHNNGKLFERRAHDSFDRRAPYFSHGTSIGNYPIEVYCDGGYVHYTTYNGMVAHLASIGVYFPREERAPIAEMVHATSSNAAEAIAANRALQQVGSGFDVVVHVDCASVIEYLIDAQENNWSIKIDPRLSTDARLADLCKTIRKRSGRTVVKWVRGHDGDLFSGNTRADALATFVLDCQRNSLFNKGVIIGRSTTGGLPQYDGSREQTEQGVAAICETLYKIE